MTLLITWLPFHCLPYLISIRQLFAQRHLALLIANAPNLHICIHGILTSARRLAISRSRHCRIEPISLMTNGRVPSHKEWRDLTCAPQASWGVHVALRASSLALRASPSHANGWRSPLGPSHACWMHHCQRKKLSAPILSSAFNWVLLIPYPEAAPPGLIPPVSPSAIARTVVENAARDWMDERIAGRTAWMRDVRYMVVVWMCNCEVDLRWRACGLLPLRGHWFGWRWFKKQPIRLTSRVTWVI